MFKSDYGSTMFHNIDTITLCLDFISADCVQSFDKLFEKCKHIYEIHSLNDEWHCTCPCLMECAMCKNEISFKLNV